MRVTVDNQCVSLANLKMSGILNKTEHVPLEGDALVFEKSSYEILFNFRTRRFDSQ